MADDEPDALSLSNQLCFTVYATAHAFARVYRPLLEPLGLTYPQYLVMLALWEEDGRSVGAIGHALQLDSGTLTPLLKRLQGLGLVRRERAGDDERRVVVRLTPAGQALKVRASGVPGGVLCAMGGDMAEVTAVKAGLERLRARLLAAAAEPEANP